MKNLVQTTSDSKVIIFFLLFHFAQKRKWWTWFSAKNYYPNQKETPTHIRVPNPEQYTNTIPFGYGKTHIIELQKNLKSEALRDSNSPECKIWKNCAISNAPRNHTAFKISQAFRNSSPKREKRRRRPPTPVPESEEGSRERNRPSWLG